MAARAETARYLAGRLIPLDIPQQTNERDKTVGYLSSTVWTLKAGGLFPASEQLDNPAGTIQPMGLVRIGERFSGEIRFTQAEIARFARSVGDHNPLHHDQAFAKETRFGGIIASGPQPASWFMALVATHFSRTTSMLGLEFSLKFLGPTRPDELLSATWEVTEVAFKEKLNGEIVKLEGSAINPKGDPVLSGTGTVLVTEKL